MLCHPTMSKKFSHARIFLLSAEISTFRFIILSPKISFSNLLISFETTQTTQCYILKMCKEKKCEKTYQWYTSAYSSYKIKDGFAIDAFKGALFIFIYNILKKFQQSLILFAIAHEQRQGWNCKLHFQKVGRH